MEEALSVSLPQIREATAPITLSQILQKKANLTKANLRTQTPQVIQPGSDKDASIQSLKEEVQEEEEEEFK